MCNTKGYFDTRILRKGDHYEVYVDDEFVCSADTMVEAATELDEYVEARRRSFGEKARQTQEG